MALFLFSVGEKWIANEVAGGKIFSLSFEEIYLAWRKRTPSLALFVSQNRNVARGLCWNLGLDLGARFLLYIHVVVGSYE